MTHWSLSGWWLGHPSENYDRQLGWLFPIYGKIKLMFQTTNQLFSSPWFWGTIPPGGHRFYQLAASHPALSLPPSALWQPGHRAATGDVAFGPHRPPGFFVDETWYNMMKPHMTGTIQWECFTLEGRDSIDKKLKLLQDLRTSKHISTLIQCGSETQAIQKHCGTSSQSSPTPPRPNRW